MTVFSAESIAIRALEWDRMVHYAEEEARSVPGKALIRQLENPTTWASQVSAAKLMQLEVQEMVPLLDRDALWGPLSDLDDPSSILERLGRGSILEVSELATLRRWLYATDSWTQVPREEIHGERFKRALSLLSDPWDALRVLEPVLTPEGELSEKASPRLSALHAEIRHLKREIGNVLDSLIKDLSQKGVLQESFSDVRDGRYVIPVRISSQHEVEGTTYEASVSRQTVFIEPKEVSSLNNRLRQKQNELIQEIYLVLEATSKKLFPLKDEILISVQVLSHWDSIQAKARLGRHYSGKAILVSEERRFFLKQTAHPLLWWSMPTDSIIRNDLDFGYPVKTLLLTGPNTGGKTVLLKTLGLAGICARTGFLFPSTDQPHVPFFDSFFADLGDSQSIENHLSSFSGHVLKFKQILEQMTDRSLILIDELNSATDPEEGAAFGRAVLETLMSRDTLIVTTTHDPHLKALAVSDVRIVNASMAFDEKSRTPTYLMNLGVPGRSRALETAERLGIPPSVVALARSYLSREHNEFEDLLARLEEDTKETQRARKEAVALREEADRLKKTWTEKTEASVSDMMERTRQKLRRILEQAQDDIRSSVRKMDMLKHRREVDQFRSQITEIFGAASSQLEPALREEAPEIAKALAKATPNASAGSAEEVNLCVGAQVRVPKWKSTGKIIEITGSKVKVALGTLQVVLSLHEIEVIAPAASPGRSSVRMPSLETSFTPSPEIDLRGKRFEEAMSELERYIDLVFRSGNQVEVTVIHGLGTGALREGTLQLLKRLPYVKSFRDGGVGQGGAGATIVEFDR